ncbi:MAG: glycosyl transferase [Planctomycetes bacterium DG_23]|nr:MAG: glycosyl transferase [Planctomycetes bacterium DG_23]
MKLSVCMPVYNEEATLEEIVRRVMEADAGLAKELIIVDDGSTDGTREVLEGLKKRYSEEDIKIFYQDPNQGKGAAVRRAFAQATGDILIIQDADLEYDPADYSKLLQPILEGKADVVYGSRFLGGPHRVLLFWHYVGNKFLTTLTNTLYNINLSDMETCYKALKKEVIRSFTLKQNRFGIEPELTAKVAKRGFRLYEVPISYSGRGYEEGKKITWRDGFRALWVLFKYRFRD